MILSLKKNIFLLLFACFQVLLFFSFFTAYELIVIALFLLFLLFYFHYFRLKVVIDIKIGLLWLGLIFFLLISSIFTHSFPLTLDTLIFHVATFVIFTFFRSLGASKIIKKQELVVTFLLVGLVLSAFFIAFFSFPDIATFLPPVNIFTTKHGHSHFAVLLLLLIPLAWQFVISNEYKSFNSRQSILFLFYVLLVFTFGRFAILISLFQLPFLYKLAKQKKIKKVYLYLVSFILIVALVVIGIFSFESSENCAVHEFRSQICKPISKEIRPEYFRQAVLSFKSYPLFGYGPGTFSLITKRFNVLIQRSSIYTHNVFLQTFAESGFFVGTTYLLLITLLFRNMFNVVKNTKKSRSLNSFIFLGLVSLLLNSLMDFDWNLFPVYQITMIFVAMVLWDFQGNYLGSKQVVKKYLQTFFKYSWFFLTTIVIILGVINLTTKILSLTHNDSLAFKIFPYFYSQSGHFLTESNLSSDQKKSLYKLYKNHKKFILDEIENSQELERKKELYKQLIVVSPWEFTNIDYYKVLKELGDYKTLGETSHKGLNLLFDLEEEESFFQEYEVKKEMMIYLFWAANEHIKREEFDIAASYYKNILIIQKWIFHVATPIFLEVNNLDPNKVDKFLRDIDIEIEDFGKNRAKMESWYLNNF